MVLAAACQVLFSRWSGQDDIALGTATSGRDRPELEASSGSSSTPSCCARPWPAVPAFSQFLTEVRETVLDAFAHHDAPFERVVDELARPSATPAARRSSTP